MTQAALRPATEELRLIEAIYPVSRETIERLAIFRALLGEWQVKTNLVAPATLAQFWTRHVADSLQCAALAGEKRKWIDLGSGGGFPGLVIAIAQADEPAASHTLIEANARKCAFLRRVSRAAGARAIIVQERIESVAQRIAGDAPQLVTARAVAPLPRLIELAQPLLSTGATGLFHKGQNFRAELANCRGLWRFDLLVHRSRVEPASALLEISNPVREARGEVGEPTMITRQD